MAEELLKVNVKGVELTKHQLHELRDTLVSPGWRHVEAIYDAQRLNVVGQDLAARGEVPAAMQWGEFIAVQIGVIEGLSRASLVVFDLAAAEDDMKALEDEEFQT